MPDGGVTAALHWSRMLVAPLKWIPVIFDIMLGIVETGCFPVLLDITSRWTTVLVMILEMRL